MSEPIDHYAKAIELARIAESKAVDSRHYAAVAHLHLDLYHGRPQVEVNTDTAYWEQAGRLEALTAAVKAWLDVSAGRALIGDPFVQDMAELIDYRAPEA